MTLYWIIDPQGLLLLSYLHCSFFVVCTHMHACAQYTHTCTHVHNTHTHARTHTIHIHMHACAQYTYTYSFYKLLPYTNTLCSTKKEKAKRKKKRTKDCFWSISSSNNKHNDKEYTVTHALYTAHVTLQNPCLQCEWLFNEGNSKLDVKLGAIFHQHVREHCVYTWTTVKLESTL